MRLDTILFIVYIIGLICIFIMKKLQPEDKIYPVWVVVVCVMLTCFLKWYVSSVQAG